MNPDTMTLRTAEGAHVSRPPSRGWWWNFTQGTAGGLFVQLIGSLSLLEVFFLATLPVRIGHVIQCASTRGVGLFAILWVGWISGAVLADVVNQTPWSLAARGIARAFFTGFVTLCLLPIWMRTSRAFEAFLAGAPLAQLIGLKYFRSGTYNVGDGTTMIDASELGWENWGNYIASATVTLLIARYWRKAPWGCVALALSLGILNLALGSRAVGITQFAAGAIMPIFILQPEIRAHWRGRNRRLGMQRLIVAALVGAIALAAAAAGYTQLAKLGTLGERAKRKYDAQSLAKGGLLAGGRAQVLIGLAAIVDKPFTGHGSWPEDSIGYAKRASELFGVEIREPTGPRNLRKFIKTHSAIVGSWVDHGILGAIFWTYVLYLVAINFWRVTQYLPEYTGVVVFICCTFFWHFFFSPVQTRAYTATILVPILIIQMRRFQGRRGREHYGRLREFSEPLRKPVRIPA